jgi:stringent starvation protein B
MNNLPPDTPAPDAPSDSAGASVVSLGQTTKKPADVAVAEPDAAPGSTKPYLIRAIHEWCTDNGFTPYLSVVVDGRCVVPKEFVKNGEIVLNVGYLATSGLKISNDRVDFSARFSGKARSLSVPIDQVSAIYARENGHGMGFEITALRSEHRPPVKPDLSTVASAEAVTASEAAPSVAPSTVASVDAGSTTSAPAHDTETTPVVPNNVTPLTKPARTKLTVVK